MQERFFYFYLLINLIRVEYQFVSIMQCIIKYEKWEGYVPLKLLLGRN